LNHSTSPFFVMSFFEIESCQLFSLVVSNCIPPDLSLLCSYDYRCEPPASSLFFFFKL
jgi:hypothetical protein